MDAAILDWPSLAERLVGKTGRQEYGLSQIIIRSQFLRHMTLYGIIGLTSAMFDFGMFYILNTFLMAN